MTIVKNCEENLLRMSSFIRNTKNAYINFISQNPNAVLQIEKSLNTASYIYEGLSKNYKNSIFVREIVSSANNLFAYANACLLLKSKRSEDISSKIINKIRHVLSVIEFSQAFIEITINKIYGEKLRWLIVSIICLIKVLLRCILLFCFNSGIQIPSKRFLLDHKSLILKSQKQEDSNNEDFFIGKNSGVLMKTLNSSLSKDQQLVSLPPSRLTGSEKFGEFLHIFRPIIHLSLVSITDFQSFIPWIISLISDASSHVLLQRNEKRMKKLIKIERIELKRRYLNLLLYLLRSPIFDKYSKLIFIIKFFDIFNRHFLL